VKGGTLASKQKKKKGGGAAKKGSQGSGFPVMPVIATLLVIIVGIGAGVLIWSQTSGDNGDIELETGIDLPGYVNSADAPIGTEKAYQVALTIPDDLAQVPCYCGCGGSAGHNSNLDCFIKQRSGNNVVFDDHAAY
jgi:hypothetical protein